MAISLITSNSVDQVSGSTITLTHGFTILAGDVLVALVHNNTATGNPTDNNGSTPFTRSDGAATAESSWVSVWYRLAGSSEPSTYSFTVTDHRCSLIVLQFRGVDPTVWDVAPAAANRITTISGFSGSMAAPSITIGTSGAYGLVFATTDYDPISDTFSSVNNSYALIRQESGQQWAAVCGRSGLSTGATGTTSVDTTDTYITAVGWQAALKPATITEVSSPGVVAAGTSATPTITHGLTILSGDVVVACVHINNNNYGTPVITSDESNGLTEHYEVADGGTCTAGYGGIWAVYSKKSAGSEPASYGFTAPGSTAWAVAVRVFRGCDPTSWWDVTPGAGTYAEDAGVGTTATSSNMTIATAGAVGVMFGFTDTASFPFDWSSPTNLWGTPLQQTTTYHLYSSIRPCESVGAIGTAQWTLSASNDWQVILGALKPSSGASVSSDRSFLLARGIGIA